MTAPARAHTLPFVLCAVSAMLCGTALARGAVPSPSPALLDALRAVRTSSMDYVMPKVRSLSAPDRDAMMYWLSSHGRNALHALGVTDAQIGVPYWKIDYTIIDAPLPSTVQPQQQRSVVRSVFGTVLPEMQIPPDAVAALMDESTAHITRPQPWRALPFAVSTLGPGGSGIHVTRGFAATRNDGTEGLACISFTNETSRVVNEIDVDIEILDAAGVIRRAAPLSLRGWYAPGVEVGVSSKTQSLSSSRATCVIDGERAHDDATDPFSGAAAVVYSVRRVLFADASQWQQYGANDWN